jgi:hypothetical protein
MITFGIDINVTRRKSIEYLDSIGLIGAIEENKLKENKTIYFDMDVHNLHDSYNRHLENWSEEMVYASVISKDGITLFTCKEVGEENLNIYIPMSNVNSICIKG